MVSGLAKSVFANANLLPDLPSLEALAEGPRRAMGRRMLRALGWTAVGQKPVHDKYVLVAAPHTSNWDLPVGMAVLMALGVRVSWMGKRSLFEGPHGWLMRSMGGFPVHRGAKAGVVDQIVQEFERSERMVLAVAPEGTRSRADFWKTGFFHIARQAGVPIVPGFLDYRGKEGGLGPEVWPSLGRDWVIEQLDGFYADKTGLYPEQFGPVRLREVSPNREVTCHAPTPDRRAGLRKAPI